MRKTRPDDLLRSGLMLLLLATALVAAPEEAESTRKSGAGVWGGSYFPNVVLTTHEGEQVRFFDDLIAGKIVMVNFIYTTCPDACPLETAKLSEVQQILGDRVGSDIFFYSITIDPDHDTPEVLARYAERFQTGPGWKFLTGSEEDIVLLRKKLGLYLPDIDQESGDHNLNLVIGNQATGRWMKRSPFENPYVLAADLGGTLDNYQMRTGTGGDYSTAPELRRITRGESLFRTRCATCHHVGSGDGSPRIGPNLLGMFDRHEEEWLRRWIYEPDVMLAEGDPIATGLFLAYNKVPMPNMQLNELELDALMDYLRAEDRRVSKIESVAELAERVGQEAPSCCEKEELAVIRHESPDEGDEAGCCADDLARSCCAEESSTGCCEEELAEECCAPADGSLASTGDAPSKLPGSRIPPLSYALAGIFTTLAFVFRFQR